MQQKVEPMDWVTSESRFHGEKVAFKKSLQGGKDLRITTSGTVRQEHAMNSEIKEGNRECRKQTHSYIPYNGLSGLSYIYSTTNNMLQIRSLFCLIFHLQSQYLQLSIQDSVFYPSTVMASCWIALWCLQLILYEVARCLFKWQSLNNLFPA